MIQERTDPGVDSWSSDKALLLRCGEIGYYWLVIQVDRT